MAIRLFLEQGPPGPPAKPDQEGDPGSAWPETAAICHALGPTWKRLSGWDAMLIYSETGEHPPHLEDRRHRCLGFMLVSSPSMYFARMLQRRLHRLVPLHCRLLEIPLQFSSRLARAFRTRLCRLRSLRSDGRGTRSSVDRRQSVHELPHAVELARRSGRGGRQRCARAGRWVAANLNVIDDDLDPKTSCCRRGPSTNCASFPSWSGDHRRRVQGPPTCQRARSPARPGATSTRRKRSWNHANRRGDVCQHGIIAATSRERQAPRRSDQRPHPHGHRGRASRCRSATTVVRVGPMMRSPSRIHPQRRTRAD